MEIIDQVRQAADIVDIASQYTTLRRRGRKHVGLCPFHSEKDPSFTVDSEKQLFHCFGCGVEATSLLWLWRRRTSPSRKH